jgi:hypothetical protein
MIRPVEAGVKPSSDVRLIWLFVPSLRVARRAIC